MDEKIHYYKFFRRLNGAHAKREQEIFFSIIIVIELVGYSDT